MASLDLDFRVFCKDARLEFDPVLQQQNVTFTFSAQIPVCALLEKLKRLCKVRGGDGKDVPENERLGQLEKEQLAASSASPAAAEDRPVWNNALDPLVDEAVQITKRLPPGGPGLDMGTDFYPAEAALSGLPPDTFEVQANEQGQVPPPPPPPPFPPIRQGQGYNAAARMGRPMAPGAANGAQSPPSGQRGDPNVQALMPFGTDVTVGSGPSLPSQGASEALYRAVGRGDSEEVKRLLEQKADPDWTDASPDKLPCLHRALTLDKRDVVEALLVHKASVNGPDAKGQTPLHLAMTRHQDLSPIIFLTLMAHKASVNGADVKGQTPLHLAMTRHLDLSPIIFRMLMAHKADVSQKDHSNRCPIDLAKDIATNMARSQRANSVSSRANIRLILHELTNRPTMAIHIADSEIRNAVFADMEGHFVIFNTRTQIGMFDVNGKKVVFSKRLQKSNDFIIQSISVNPQTGIIAALVEFTSKGGDDHQQMIFGFKQNGKRMQSMYLQGPRNSTIGVVSNGENRFEVPILCFPKRSQGDRFITLAARMRDGQVFCYRLCLNDRSHAASKDCKLSDDGSLIAISDDGGWIAVASWSHQSNGYGRLEVHSVGPIESDNFGSVLFAQPKDVQPCAAINIMRFAHNEGYLATSPANAGQPGLIQIWSLPYWQLLHNIQNDWPCHTMWFCPGNTLMLLSAHEDGQVVLTDLNRAEYENKSTACDELTVKSIDLSVDGKSVVSTYQSGDYFRVYSRPMF